MRWKDHECRIEREEAAKQAVEQRFRVAAGQVGASGRTDEQRVAGEHPLLAAQAHGIPRVSWRMQDL